MPLPLLQVIIRPPGMSQHRPLRVQQQIRHRHANHLIHQRLVSGMPFGPTESSVVNLEGTIKAPSMKLNHHHGNELLNQ